MTSNGHRDNDYSAVRTLDIGDSRALPAEAVDGGWASRQDSEFTASQLELAEDSSGRTSALQPPTVEQNRGNGSVGEEAVDIQLALKM